MRSIAVVFGTFFAVAMFLGACVKVEETFPPEPPSGVFVQAGDGQVRVSWNSPGMTDATQEDSKVTHFKAWAVTDTNSIYQTASKVCTVDMPDTTCVIKGLSNGTTYFFVVSAFNNAKDTRTCENHPGTGNRILPPQGQSCASTIVSATPIPLGAPGAPKGLTVVLGNAQVTLSWVAPDSNGGLPITGYKAYAVSAYAVFDTMLYCMTVDSFSCTITNLKNGKAYTFAVSAINSAGLGTPSATSAPVTPAAPPGPPTAVSALAGFLEATVNWTAPSFTGGLSITGYKAYAVNDTAKFCVTTGALSCRIDLLSNGVPYTFAVKAISSAGAGLASTPSASVTPISLPAWTGRTSNTTKTLYGVYKSTSTFVAVGDSGTILTSTNGTNWTARTSGTTSPLYSVASNDTLWVAVGASGTILTSPTGTTWTARTVGITSSIQSVIYAGQQWVAVTGAGAILTSADGITWTARNIGLTVGLKSVAWSGSLLTAVGQTGTIVTSSDGITWFKRNAGSTGDFNGIIWNGSAFVTVGGISSPQVYTSANGINWTQRATAANSPISLTSVAWTGNRLLIVGTGGAVLSTMDITTTSIYLTTLTGNQNGVAGNSSIWVVVGANGNITTSP